MNGFLNNLASLELLVNNDPPWTIALQEISRVTMEQLNRKYGWTSKREDNIRRSVTFASDFKVNPIQLTGYRLTTNSCRSKASWEYYNIRSLWLSNIF